MTLRCNLEREYCTLLIRQSVGYLKYYFHVIHSFLVVLCSKIPRSRCNLFYRVFFCNKRSAVCNKVSRSVECYYDQSTIMMNLLDSFYNQKVTLQKFLQRNAVSIRAWTTCTTKIASKLPPHDFHTSLFLSLQNVRGCICHKQRHFFPRPKRQIVRLFSFKYLKIQSIFHLIFNLSQINCWKRSVDDQRSIFPAVNCCFPSNHQAMHT